MIDEAIDGIEMVQIFKETYVCLNGKRFEKEPESHEEGYEYYAVDMDDNLLKGTYTSYDNEPLHKGIISNYEKDVNRVLDQCYSYF